MRAVELMREVCAQWQAEQDAALDAKPIRAGVARAPSRRQ